MVGLYNQLPMDDFNVSDEGNHNGYFYWNSIVSTMVSTGETVNRNRIPIYIPAKGYWSDGFKVIRQANVLIQNLPEYIGILDGAESWIGEAKFIRAYVYFQLVKRYGGMPIIEEPQLLVDGNESSLWVARSSHADSYDFILKDLDYAIEYMNAKSEMGRANKYVAAAFKSRVAVFAGSIARYGGARYGAWEDENGVMLCGIPADKANSYFQQAFDAAEIVKASGLYQLHRGNADKTADFAEVWEKADNTKESIFIRQYDYQNYTHSFDAIYCPPRMTTTYGDRYNVTLDWVELFDGLPLDSKTGRINTVDNDGNYIVYDDCRQLWDAAEPRLRASILIPGYVYKGVQLDLRAGIFNENIDPSTKFQKFSIDDGVTTQAYQNWPTDANLNMFKNGTILRATGNPLQQAPYERKDGIKINRNGMDGPANSANNTLTGFHGRKWLNVNLSVAATNLHESFQSWIDIRYAEVLLNRAEAAIELAQNGASSYNGKDMLQDAFECINDIRDRAGADLLASPNELSTAPGLNPKGTGKGSFVEAPTRGLQLLRIERYKELAFENKLYWDLRRWFTFDTQINQYRRRGLYSFMFSKGAVINEYGNPEGKYIYDSRCIESGSDRITFGIPSYYENIPGDQLKNNPLLQKNKNQ